jgi:hypothetical protein
MIIAIAFVVYILLGFLLLMKKFENETLLEKRIWSPLQALFMVVFWPIFLFLE